MNQIMKKVVPLMLLLITAGLQISAQSSLDKKTLVTIGDEKITVGEFMQVYNKNNTQSTLQEPSTIEEYLDLFINFRLKVKEAVDLQMDTIESFRTELAGYRDQLAKPYFIDESVNEDLLKEAYQRKLHDIRASHILIMVDENARPEDTLEAYNKVKNIRKEIIEGKDFADAAIEYSDDPSARDREEIPGQQRFRKGNAGDLGYFTVFNMVYPFENAAYNTAEGQVSQPVRTQFGYHLIKVVDKKEALGVAQVAHIYAALPPNSTPEDSAAKKEKINNIYQKIQEGMLFEDAVVAYSEDQGSARNGGKLSPFTCNRVVPEFVLAAQSLDTNEISEPVLTAYGYHIIKLISREKPGTFEEESPELKERLKKDSRTHKSEEVVLQRIKNENNLKIYEKAKLAVTSLIDTAVLSSTFVADTFTTFDKTIMKIGTDKFSQYDFARFIEQNQSPQNNIDKDVYLEKLFNDFVNEKALAYENKQLEDKYPEFKSLMREYHDGILLFDLTDKKVWAKAVKDTLGLEQYFEAHNADYNWDKRAEATVFQLKNNADFDTIMAIIKTYENDGDIAKKLDEDSITSVKIIPGKFEMGDNNYVDQVKWEADNIQVIPSDVEKKLTIVKIKAILPPQMKQFNEARGIATADYQGYLEDEWIRQLKDKYPVEVNHEVLQQLIATQ